MDALDLPAWLVLLLVVLATARVWRLLVVDGITEGFRIRLIASVQDRPRRWRDAFHDALFCPFCVGFWILLMLLASALAWSDEVAWQLVVGAFALNYVSGQFNARLDAEDADLSR
jgi:hypothetical protein